MAKLGELPVYGPDFSYLICLRCKAKVCVRSTGSSVELVYDTQDWRRSPCCCSHLESPVSCCCFSELKQVIDDLPVTH